MVFMFKFKGYALLFISSIFWNFWIGSLTIASSHVREVDSNITPGRLFESVGDKNILNSDGSEDIPPNISSHPSVSCSNKGNGECNDNSHIDITYSSSIVENGKYF